MKLNRYLLIFCMLSIKILKLYPLLIMSVTLPNLNHSSVFWNSVGEKKMFLRMLKDNTNLLNCVEFFASFNKVNTQTKFLKYSIIIVK